MHNTLVFATFPLHSSVFYHSTERFVKFGAVLHHDLCLSLLHVINNAIDLPKIGTGSEDLHQFEKNMKPLKAAA